MSEETKNMIIETFKKFDANNDGLISREELTRVLGAIGGDQFESSAVDALLEASDTNKDGKISYEEFVAWVTQDMQQDPKAEAFAPIDSRGGDFKMDYRKMLPERLQVDVSGRYDLDRKELGAGGFGKVFVARDREFSDRMVAVKKIQKPSRSGSELNDLHREITVMKDLDHPNICKLLGTFDEGKNMFFIMELCEGGEVFDRILEGGITEAQTAKIVAQVAGALAYAHQRGIAHRDIKPENVVFCNKDRNDFSIKLIDWGLATSFTEESMTKAVGSMTYAAPEVINSQDRKQYTEACDLWSMGVLCYVMLCGKPPFWGSREQHYKAAKAERYPFRDDPWDRMNPQAKDFVKRLLKAKPEDRLTISDCVSHPWLTEPPSSEGDNEQSKLVFTNLTNFCGQSTFSRMCITAVARQLDHKHLTEIHKVFREIDADGNGVLSMDEVRQGIKKLGIDSSQIDSLFSNLDMDGSKTIDYTEFCAAGLGAKTSDQDDVIWAAFKTFDLDNLGYITVDNMKRILDSADIKDQWSAEVCQQVGADIVSKFDADKDGKIEFDEFQKLMKECWKSKKEIKAFDLMTKVQLLPDTVA